MLADNAESDLPTLVNLAPGEALDAYLERVADANYLTTARLIEMVRAGHGSTTAYLMLAPTPATLKRIAHLTGAARAPRSVRNASPTTASGASPGACPPRPYAAPTAPTCSPRAPAASAPSATSDTHPCASLVPRRCAATLSAKAHASNAASTSPRSPPRQSPPSLANSPRPSSPPPSDP